MASSSRSTSFPPSTLQIALAASVADGIFADTAYYLYSRRLRNWKIGEPRVVYANSRVMKAASPHFTAQLDGGFATNQQIDSETQDYGYESDSDLDDSEFESDKIAKPDWQMDTQDEQCGQSASTAASASSATRVELVGAQYKYRVVVPDVAVNTWQALIHFIYTGTVYFAPLKSQGIEFRRLEQAKHREKHPDLPPLCSPKSIYRLADIVDIPRLKLIAQDDLKARMSEQTITREVFSRFSSMYSDILDMQLQILYSDAMLAGVMPKVLKMITAVTRGETPYAENALSALLLKLSTLLSGPNYKPLRSVSKASKSKRVRGPASEFKVGFATPNGLVADGENQPAIEQQSSAAAFSYA